MISLFNNGLKVLWAAVLVFVYTNGFSQGSKDSLAFDSRDSLAQESLKGMGYNPRHSLETVQMKRILGNLAEDWNRMSKGKNLADRQNWK
ncbi:MAG: hypothetical protein FJ343_07170, partial [Sphingomonadales bacterium]|nr:hypothetical protein [Sphingomonadales bacterium]